MKYKILNHLAAGDDGEIEITDYKGCGEEVGDFYRRAGFCKFERRGERLVGSFSTPDGRHFLCTVSKNKCRFEDENDCVKNIFERLCGGSFETPSLETVLSAFFTELIDDELERLYVIEHKISSLETSVLDGSISTFLHKMQPIRTELRRLHGYYTQLGECADKLTDSGIFGETQAFVTLFERCSRLAAQTQMLRDYSLQVSELYQAQVDLRLNGTMKTLTVVTSVFLPLSLITGWYGMNFANMPELTWRYGYPFVIVMAIAAAVCSILYIKRNKF